MAMWTPVGIVHHHPGVPASPINKKHCDCASSGTDRHSTERKSLQLTYRHDVAAAAGPFESCVSLCTSISSSTSSSLNIER